MHTLGYNVNSHVVANAKASPSLLAAEPDQRGRKKLADNPLHEEIDNHIKSYNPCISHYRREHAPNRLYLPHGLTIADMHKHYNEGHPERKVDYTTYMRRVNNMNISFAKLGEEECEVCTSLKMNDEHQMVNSECVKVDCGACAILKVHNKQAEEARTAYKSDGEMIIPGRVVRSVDLQKVVMLPRLPGYKSACFTKRLVGFHQTFAPVGKYCSDVKTESVLWHEAIAGRKAEDITSSVIQAVIRDRDYKDIVYYMDNCGGQNKNYSLYTALTDIVNTKKISADTITLKYLEAGHTFMSADSCHARVEKQMKKRGDVYDFADFVSCVSEAGANTITPSYLDFGCYEGGQSQAKLKQKDRPKISDLSIAQFRRGSRFIYYKTAHTEEEYRTFDYLLVKHVLGRDAPRRSSTRGFPESKKKGIIDTLCPLMPENRREFWETLPVADVPCLVDNRQ